MISQQQLKELLDYDPETGVFTWIKRRRGTRFGHSAGRDSHGYVYIRILGAEYGAHRLAWLYMTGNPSADQIGHINCIGNDNRWRNLHEANHSISGQKITQQQLKERLHYNPITGIFTWASQPHHNHKTRIGDLACARPNSRGYLRITLLGVTYYLHRLAWLYVTGRWPDNEIDHLNGAHGDNRFKNLRDVVPLINKQNQRKPQKNNSTGFLGVSRCGKGFSAILGINGKARRVGTYPTPELAHSAYLKAKRQLHPGCTI